MAIKTTRDDKKDVLAPAQDEQASESEASLEARESQDEEQTAEEALEPRTASALGGATRYVHAAFFAAGILVAFVSGKVLWTAWNRLAEWPPAVRAVPQLLRYAEDERESIAMVVGALVGVLVVIQTYRKPHVRHWANEVASELAKVTWPNREMVTNGTIVVIIASAVFTVYVALLDQFWSFLTTLVYGV